MTIERAVELLLGNLGTLFLLLLIIVGGWKRVWVWGWYAQELKERNANLEEKLERAVGVAERGTVAADRAVRALAEQKSGDAPNA